MGKVSFSVLVIWIVIGVSLATLYPIAENIQQRKTFANSDIMGSVNSDPYTGLDKSQNSSSSGNSQYSYNLQNIFNSFNSKFTSPNLQTSTDYENPQTGTNSKRKYLVDNFYLNFTNFTAEITNPDNGVTEDGFYEIKKHPSNNHKGVLQRGTFLHSVGTFTINGSLMFTPKNNEKYHILVYSNYPEHDNRVSKDEYKYNPEIV